MLLEARTWHIFIMNIVVSHIVLSLSNLPPFWLLHTNEFQLKTFKMYRFLSLFFFLFLDSPMFLLIQLLRPCPMKQVHLETVKTLAFNRTLARFGYKSLSLQMYSLSSCFLCSEYVGPVSLFTQVKWSIIKYLCDLILDFHWLRCWQVIY